MKKIFILLFATMASVMMYAERVQVDDLYYELDNENHTAQVTYDKYGEATNYSGLTTVDVPASVTYNTVKYTVTGIGDDAFYSCSSLTAITMTNNVKNIGSSAFSHCTNLASVIMGISVINIGRGAFFECTGLTHVTIGNKVSSVGIDAFYGCTGLTEITIPASVTEIGNSAFSHCSGLTSVTNYAHTPQTIESGVFYEVDKTACTLYVPQQYIDAYAAADEWKDFHEILPIGSQSLEETQIDAKQSIKTIHEGHVLIQRGDKVYTITGQETK